MADLWRELSAPPYRAERDMALPTAGEVRTIAWMFEALLGDGGGLRGVFGLGRDVTERRAAEEAARRGLGWRRCWRPSPRDCRARRLPAWMRPSASP